MPNALDWLQQDVQLIRWDIQQNNRHVAEIAEHSRAISLGIQQLQADLRWSVTEITTKLDTQSVLLEHAVRALENPLATQANEARRMGLRRFHAGLSAEAKEAFQRVLQTNLTDHVAHLFLALIAYQQEAWSTALDHAERAARYAKQEYKEQQWASTAYALAARIHNQLGDTARAHHSATEAMRLSSTSGSAYYELARAAASLQDGRQTTQALTQAFNLDPTLFTQATDDTTLEAVRPAVTALQARFQAEADGKLEEVLMAGRKLQKLGSAVRQQLPPAEGRYLQDHQTLLDAIQQKQVSYDYPVKLQAYHNVVSSNRTTRQALLASIALRQHLLQHHINDWSDLKRISKAMFGISLVAALIVAVSFPNGVRWGELIYIDAIVAAALVFLAPASICFLLLILKMLQDLAINVRTQQQLSQLDRVHKILRTEG